MSQETIVNITNGLAKSIVFTFNKVNGQFII